MRTLWQKIRYGLRMETIRRALHVALGKTRMKLNPGIPAGSRLLMRIRGTIAHAVAYPLLQPFESIVPEENLGFEQGVAQRAQALRKLATKLLNTREQCQTSRPLLRQTLVAARSTASEYQYAIAAQPLIPIAQLVLRMRQQPSFSLRAEIPRGA